MPIRPAAKITFPLDIPDVDVMSTKQTSNGQFIITVESSQATTRCGVCKQEIACNYGHGEAVRLRHLPILGSETYIEIRPRRGQCGTCLHSPTTTQQMGWYRQRSPHTLAYENYLMKQLIGSSVADVSMKEKIGYDAVVGVLGRHVPKQVNWEEIDDIGTIGIDEVATKKGHKGYRAIVTARQDDGTVHVLGVLKDRKKRRSKRS